MVSALGGPIIAENVSKREHPHRDFSAAADRTSMHQSSLWPMAHRARDPGMVVMNMGEGLVKNSIVHGPPPYFLIRECGLD